MSGAIFAASLAWTLAARGATVTATVPSPPRFLYVTNSQDNTMSISAIDSTTGLLRPRGYIPCGNFPLPVTVDPLNKFLFAGSFGTGEVYSYAIDATGALTLKSTVSGDANDLSCSLDGKFLFSPNLLANNIGRFSINASTGVLTSLGTTPAGATPESVVLHPTQAVAYCPGFDSDDIARYTLNSGSGALTEVPPRVASGGTKPGPLSMAVTRTGSFAYVANFSTSTVSAFTVGAAGALSAIGAPLKPSNFAAPGTVAVDNASKFVYVSCFDSNNVSVFSIGPSGALTLVQQINAGTNPARLALDPSGKFAYVANRGSNDVTVFSIDATTGLLTRVSSSRVHRQPLNLAIQAGTAPVTVTPRFAYVTNIDSNSLSCFSINASTGALTPLSPATVATGGNQPLWAQVHPNQKWLYVNVRGSNTDGTSGTRGVQVFTINQTTGALTAGAVATSENGSRRFTIDPSGRFLYNTCDTTDRIACFSIDPTTGALTRLAGAAGTVDLGFNCWGIGAEPAGLYVLVPDLTNNVTKSFKIDLVTGALTLAGTSPSLGTDQRSAEIELTGRFVYVASLSGAVNVSAYTFAGDGSFATIGTAAGSGTQPIQTAPDPRARFVYVANFGSNDVSVFAIDPTSGALTGGARTSVGTRPQGCTVDPSGKFFYTPNSGSNNVSVLTINQTTGALTSVGTVDVGTRPHTVAIAATIQ